MTTPQNKLKLYQYYQREWEKTLAKPAQNRENFDAQICEIMPKILNISEEDILQNSHLFEKIDRKMLNALYYLSKINSLEGKNNAVHSLEFVYRFNMGIDEYLRPEK
ncbi:MAG: hypothetical protein ACJAZX_001216 [Rickettsiales bacterium]|jgi:hypothetical protein